MQCALATEPLPILVVDDDNAIIRTLADILRLHGYAPSVAATGEEGLNIARRHSPALAILDLRLPDMNGLELAARLHQLSQLTEVVVLTGNASVESAIGALREHSVDYLVKPVNVDRLLQVASLASERWHLRQTQEQLRDSDERFRRIAQRMDAVGRLASGISHDFKNMLSAITGFSESVHSNLPANDPLRGEVEEILKAAGKAEGLTRQLLALSKEQVLQPQNVRLNDVIMDMERMLGHLIGKNVELRVRTDPDLAQVKIDPGQVEQVIVNLCMNARDAMPAGGRLTIEARNVELDQSPSQAHASDAPFQYVMLALSDTGEGMDAETKARIFEPFFTTKAPDKGTGLGLATVYGVVKQSGGEICVYSEKGRGTTFKIFLPAVVDATTHLGGWGRVDSGSGTGSETILLAEDEPAIRRLAKRTLERFGYTVLTASNGREAVEIARTYEGTIHLLVTDLMMPGLNGTEVARTIRRSRPRVRVLFLSGHSDATVVYDGRMEQGSAFLEKPFASGALARKARETLDREN